MKNIMRIIDFFLDLLKKTLVRFKDAKFGLLFFINIFKLPDFFTDKDVNIISKFKVISSLATALFYIVSSIDVIPEILTGPFGFIDDLFVLAWCLGIVNEEIERYKKVLKEKNDPNIIEDVKFDIKDEE